MNIEQAVRALADCRNDRGNPIKGKLQHLVLNVTNDGWQAIAQFWFVEKWNVSVGTDPVACLLDVLTTPPNMTPFPPSTPDFVKAVAKEPAAARVFE